MRRVAPGVCEDRRGVDVGMDVDSGDGGKFVFCLFLFLFFLFLFLFFLFLVLSTTSNESMVCKCCKNVSAVEAFRSISMNITLV